ncbi:MAG: SufE family protein [Rhodobacterales bacterium]|jgi:cysteine desulfuration protein SufE|uniref:SufE family protein n=1 Tax=uncultured Planktomarina sp. TaxID=1538529 RepID=UPI0032612E19|tara:strand:- start:405 stop:812 length:408 start_codon:yes stop_codon:yes gene_type:complete
MAQADFEDLVETFELLEDWEDRYRHVIDLGKALPDMPEALRVPATKVDGCASQVWLHITIDNGVLTFIGESDAIIVRGLIAVLMTLYSGLQVSEIGRIDVLAELGRLGLNEHLSSQRSNGLRAMVTRVVETAAAA